MDVEGRAEASADHADVRVIVLVYEEVVEERLVDLPPASVGRPCVEPRGVDRQSQCLSHPRRAKLDFCFSLCQTGLDLLALEADAVDSLLDLGFGDRAIRSEIE